MFRWFFWRRPRPRTGIDEALEKTNLPRKSTEWFEDKASIAGNGPIRSSDVNKSNNAKKSDNANKSNNAKKSDNAIKATKTKSGLFSSCWGNSSVKKEEYEDEKEEEDQLDRKGKQSRSNEGVINQKRPPIGVVEIEASTASSSPALNAAWSYPWEVWRHNAGEEEVGVYEETRGDGVGVGEGGCGGVKI